jgi:transcriptional regulator with XRE-family HTH domain
VAPPRRAADSARYNAVIARRIKSQRIAVGLTQDALAERIDYTRVTVHHVETGRHDVSIYLLYRLSSAFGCSIYDLLPEHIEEELEKENVYHLASILNVDADINEEDLSTILGKIKGLKPKSREE